MPQSIMAPSACQFSLSSARTEETEAHAHDRADRDGVGEDEAAHHPRHLPAALLAIMKTLAMHGTKRVIATMDTATSSGESRPARARSRRPAAPKSRRRKPTRSASLTRSETPPWLQNPRPQWTIGPPA